MTDCAACNLFNKMYGRMVAFADRVLQPLVLLTFRAVWGYKFFQVGMGKLGNHDGVAEYFASLGIPAPGFHAWFIGGLECVGGLLLLLGLFSRPIALVLTINMIVAYATAHSQELFGVFSDLKPFLTVEPFFFLLTSVLVLAFGPGCISLDALVSKCRCKKQAAGCCQK